MDTNILRVSILVIREEGKAGEKGPCILTCKWHHSLTRLCLLEMHQVFSEVQREEVCLQELEE